MKLIFFQRPPESPLVTVLKEMNNVSDGGVALSKAAFQCKKTAGQEDSRTAGQPTAPEEPQPKGQVQLQIWTLGPISFTFLKHLSDCFHCLYGLLKIRLTYKDSSWAGELAQSAKCLTGKQKDPSSIPITHVNTTRHML